MGGRIFGRNAQTLENTPTPLFGEPLKFIAHGRTFERLRYYEAFIYDVIEMLQLSCETF